jgi:hypothetical protein
MKHIGFDQSTVLNEYARIAVNNGLVKQAQEATEVVEQSESTEPGVVTFEKGTTIAIPEAKKAFDAFLNDLGKERILVGLFNSLKQWKIPPKTDPVKLGQILFKEFGWQPMVLQLLKKHFPQSIQSDKQATNKNDSKKVAEQSIYNVSGETGEQLVEKAHPGGGTKTELTHSKTDENLVETIVEQQDADVGVARSVPKGTYAALVNLYLKLNKMGYGKHLGELRKAINKIATREDYVFYTLNMLADKLDNIGHSEAANRIDEILKVAVTTTQQNALRDVEKQMVDTMVDTMVSRLPGGATAGGQRSIIQNQKNRSFQEARHNIERLVNSQPELRSTFNEALSAVYPYMNQYVALKQQVESKAPGVYDMKTPIDEKGKAGVGDIKTMSWKQRVLTDWPTAKKFADWYMKMMKGILGDENFVKSEHRIPINRIEDGVTRPMRRGIQRALSYIKENYGSGAKLKEAYDIKMAIKSPKEIRKPGVTERVAADERTRLKLQDQVYSHLVRMDSRWADEPGVQNRIRKLVEQSERYHDLSNPDGYSNALRIILNQF